MYVCITIQKHMRKYMKIHTNTEWYKNTLAPRGINNNSNDYNNIELFSCSFNSLLFLAPKYHLSFIIPPTLHTHTHIYTPVHMYAVPYIHIYVYLLQNV